MKFKDLDLGSFSQYGTQYLMQELGIDTVLYQPMCDLHDNIYKSEELEEGQ
jgi:hypothetical protein